MKEQNCPEQQKAKKVAGFADFALSNHELSKLKGGNVPIVNEEGNFIVEDELTGL